MTNHRSKKLALAGMPYPDRIIHLVEEFLPVIDKIGAAAELCIQLGTAGLQWDFEQHWNIDPAQATPVEHEDLITETLLHLLRLYGAKRDFIDDSDFSILDGLWKESRWRRCLEDTGDSHALAALVLGVLDRTGSSHGNENYDEVVADLSHSIIMSLGHEWLGISYTELPSMERLTKDFFGDAWYEFVVLNDSNLVSNIPEAVRTLLPPFRDGLLAARLSSIAMGLPALHT